MPTAPSGPATGEVRADDAGRRRRGLRVVDGLAKAKGAKSSIDLTPVRVAGPLRNRIDWWSRGESNPRPLAIVRQIYMLSWLIWF